MRHYLLLLSIIPPFISAIAIPWLGRKRRDLPLILSLAGNGLSITALLALARRVYTHRQISQNLGHWGLPWGIELTADYLNVILALTINIIGCLLTLYSREYITRLLSEEKYRAYYYCLLNLLLGSMLAFLLAGDFFTMFVYLSLFSLAGVALIAIGRERQAVLSAFRYLILSTTGGTLILLGIALLYYYTGTLNQRELLIKLAAYSNPNAIYIAVSFIIVGFSIKAALFPLHVWMPDAHGFAPSPISAILSGLVIELGAYGILRAIFLLLALKGGNGATPFKDILCWLSAAAIIYGSLGAILQQDIKLILAYSSVSQIGYITMGIALASYFSLLGGLLHIINHAIMKSALFLSAGALVYKTGFRKLNEMEGLGRQMPYTSGALAITAIAMVGIPPACGFVSEWYICMGAIEAQQPFFAAFILLGSLLSTVYYLRIINALYFKKSAPKTDRTVVNEAPLSMLMPIWALTLASLWLGIYNRFPLLWLERAVEGIL